jgi:hypothetical protein
MICLIGNLIPNKVEKSSRVLNAQNLSNFITREAKS